MLRQHRMQTLQALSTACKLEPMTVFRLRRSHFSKCAAIILACFGPKPITAQHGWVVVRHAVMLRQHRMQRLKVLSKHASQSL